MNDLGPNPLFEPGRAVPAAQRKAGLRQPIAEKRDDKDCAESLICTSSIGRHACRAAERCSSSLAELLQETRCGDECCVPGPTTLNGPIIM